MLDGGGARDGGRGPISWRERFLLCCNPVACRATTALAAGFAVALAVAVSAFGLLGSDSLLAWHAAAMAIAVLGFHTAAAVLHYHLPQPKSEVVKRYKMALIMVVVPLALGAVFVVLDRLGEGESLRPRSVHALLGAILACVLLVHLVYSVATNAPDLNTGRVTGGVNHFIALLVVFSGCWHMFPESWALTWAIVAVGVTTMIARSCWVPPVSKDQMLMWGWTLEELKMIYDNPAFTR